MKEKATGEAVAIGMYQITKIAEEKGLTKRRSRAHPESPGSL